MAKKRQIFVVFKCLSVCELGTLFHVRSSHVFFAELSWKKGYIAFYSVKKVIGRFFLPDDRTVTALFL
jgi:hypothetical protein